LDEALRALAAVEREAGLKLDPGWFAPIEGIAAPQSVLYVNGAARALPPEVWRALRMLAGDGAWALRVLGEVRRLLTPGARGPLSERWARAVSVLIREGLIDAGSEEA
jgi:hypothetical protein